ncbi:MAG: Y-family DNA polymerase, partial [Alphaproteobacteria bacterium]
MVREQPSSSAKDRAPWLASSLVTIAAQGSGHTGLRLIAVNDAAADAGLYPGKNLADARALEPGLHAVEADPVGDARALSGLADWCGRYSPWTAASGLESDGSGGIWIDISGCAHLFGDEATLLGDLVGQLARLGYAARVSVADTAGTAWAVARYGHGDSNRQIIVPAGEQEAAIRDLPIAGLRLPAAIVGDIDRLGLRRIGDLLALPRHGLAARFGAVLPQRLDQALGRIAEPISPRQPQPSLRVRMNFAEPVGRPEDIAAAAK